MKGGVLGPCVSHHFFGVQRGSAVPVFHQFLVRALMTTETLVIMNTSDAHHSWVLYLCPYRVWILDVPDLLLVLLSVFV